MSVFPRFSDVQMKYNMHGGTDREVRLSPFSDRKQHLRQQDDLYMTYAPLSDVSCLFQALIQDV